MGLEVITVPTSQDRMEIDLPGMASDLLPYRDKPLDLYRAHFWHAGFDHGKRTPFAAMYTSLGCNFACDFCMISIVNRSDNDDAVDSSHSRGMRFWSPDFVVGEMERLAGFGLRTLRISDEIPEGAEHRNGEYVSLPGVAGQSDAHPRQGRRTAPA